MSIERHPLFIRPKLELCREIDRLRAELANLKALLKDICDEWSEDCDPGCDSVAHTEHCKAQNIAEAKRAMREENERLRAELSECKADAERYHWIKQCALFGITKRQDIVLTLPIYAANHIGELDAGIDAARKGEGE